MNCLKVSAFLHGFYGIGNMVDSIHLLSDESHAVCCCHVEFIIPLHCLAIGSFCLTQNIIVANLLSSEECGGFFLILGDFASGDPNQAKVSFPALAEDSQNLFRFHVFMETRMLFLQKAPLLCESAGRVSDNSYMSCFAFFLCHRTCF